MRVGDFFTGNFIAGSNYGDSFSFFGDRKILHPKMDAADDFGELDLGFGH
jgi:hypothetical protein